MRLAGIEGEIKWSYMTAARFGPWKVDTHPDGTASLTGGVVSIDPYRVSQAPLKARLWIGNHTQTRPIVTLQITAESITATLGPSESK